MPCLPMLLRRILAVGAVLGAVAALEACATATPGAGQKKVAVTTVAPLTDIAYNVACDRVELVQTIPDGADSHTFSPPPSVAKDLARADLIILNGLHLEEPTRRLAEANKKASAPLLLLADNTITPEQWLDFVQTPWGGIGYRPGTRVHPQPGFSSCRIPRATSKKSRICGATNPAHLVSRRGIVQSPEWVFDFSFPASGGDPNPHLWTNPLLAKQYALLIRDKLAEVDPTNAQTYRQYSDRYAQDLDALDRAARAAVASIPQGNRRLLTYHDSWAYFAPEYGMTVIGAIQPSDFSNPSAREVADLISHVKAERVPAIFGSEVYPSNVMEQMARETGVKYVTDLRDDDPPGDPGCPEHWYVGMMAANLRSMADALGGDPKALDGVPTVSHCGKNR